MQPPKGQMTNSKDYREILALLQPDRIPAHVGIIMDGNGRWAKEHRRPRLFGHRAGAKTTRLAVELGVELKLECLTLYAFSTENWSRPKAEVEGLMKLLKEYLIKEIPNLQRQNVQLHFIGSDTGVDPVFLSDIRSSAAITHQNTGMRLNIAFNYGGRIEIVEAIRKLKQAAEQDSSIWENLNQQNFGDYLYTAGTSDPDLIIRTSGEMRLSNFLLWQAAYSEIYVTPIYWPDFDKVQFALALLDYQNRNRRFGGVKAK